MEVRGDEVGGVQASTCEIGPDHLRARQIETLCQQYWAATLAGEPVLLNQGEMASVLRRFKSYGKQAGELAKGQVHAVLPPTRRDAPKASDRRR